VQALQIVPTSAADLADCGLRIMTEPNGRRSLRISRARLKGVKTRIPR
jgi:hypothetical protein